MHDDSDFPELLKQCDALLKKYLNGEGLAFWEQSGVTEDVLTEHGVCQINDFSETDEYGEVKVVDLKDSEVCFAYQFPGFVKLYFPKRKEYRYQFLGNKIIDYYFGSELLDNNAH